MTVPKKIRAMQSLIAKYARKEISVEMFVANVRGDVEAYSALIQRSVEETTAAIEALDTLAGQRWPRNDKRALAMLADSIANQPKVEQNARRAARARAADDGAFRWDGSIEALRPLVERATAAKYDLLSFSGSDCHVDVRTLRAMLPLLAKDARARLMTDGDAVKLVIRYGDKGRYVLRTEPTSKHSVVPVTVDAPQRAPKAAKAAPAPVAPPVASVPAAQPERLADVIPINRASVPAPSPVAPAAPAKPAVRYVVLPPEVAHEADKLERKEAKRAERVRPPSKKRGPKLADSTCPHCLDRARYYREAAPYRKAKAAAKTPEALAAALALRPVKRFPKSAEGCARCAHRYRKRTPTASKSKSEVAA